MNRGYDPDDPRHRPVPRLDVDAVQELHDRHRRRVRAVRWFAAGVSAVVGTVVLVLGLAGDAEDDDDDAPDDPGPVTTLVVPDDDDDDDDD